MIPMEPDQSRLNNQLIIYAARDNFDLVAQALKQGADINARNSSYETALTLAARRGSPKLCKLLLNHGADIEAVGGSGRTALGWAAEEFRPQTCRLLLAHQAPMVPLGTVDWSPLHLAIASGITHESTEIIELFLEKGASLDHEDQGGYTPLHIAIHGHYPGTTKKAFTGPRFREEEAAPIVQFLLLHGANPNKKDRKNYTPLGWALLQNKNQTCKLLLKHGAEVADVTDSESSQ